MYPKKVPRKVIFLWFFGSGVKGVPGWSQRLPREVFGVILVSFWVPSAVIFVCFSVLRAPWVTELLLLLLLFSSSSSSYYSSSSSSSSSSPASVSASASASSASASASSPSSSSFFFFFCLVPCAFCLLSCLFSLLSSVFCLLSSASATPPPTHKVKSCRTLYKQCARKCISVMFYWVF